MLSALLRKVMEGIFSRHHLTGESLILTAVKNNIDIMACYDKLVMNIGS